MNESLIQPYLFFGGRCEEALAFYRLALGAEIEFLMHHKDSPDAPPPGMVQPVIEAPAEFRVRLPRRGAAMPSIWACDAGRARPIPFDPQ
jgi:hypothetical protein